jgi:hypothetical protein
MIELTSVNLGYSILFVMPLIQAIIMTQLVAFFIRSFLSKKKPTKFTPLKHKLLDAANLQKDQKKFPGFNSNSNSNSPFNPARESIQLNYASITPKSYTLMKYIESDNNRRANSATNLNFNLNQQENYFSKSNSCELVKPARFSPSESNTNGFTLKSKTARKNSFEDSIGMYVQL